MASSSTKAGLMDVYWLEQNQADVPPVNDWLSAGETLLLESLRFAKRRADWRLGRWTAKRSLALYLNIPDRPEVLAKLEIRAESSGAPQVFAGNKPAAVTISLSHRSGIAMCAVARAGVELGCDLEMIEPRSDTFVADYFTVEEQERIARAGAADRSRLLALLWSGKESTLKALREGLRLDTRSVIVTPASVDRDGWSPFEAHYTGGRIFRGWWQRADNIVRTVVADPSPDSPVPLNLMAHLSAQASRCA
jgi:4'-phosphopantetheinyl transferase